MLQHGEGSKFKSTMVDTVSYVLGDYAMSLPIGSLVDSDRKRASEASPDLARLPGARLVRAAEPKRGAALDESIIKQLTGGEQITARHLNKGFFDFRPTFKLVISFNRRPTIRGDDDGIWRRLWVVPFPVQLPRDKQDKSFGEKLKAEGPAILNWMIDGFRLWRKRGLVVPEVIQRATAAYRMDSDPLGPFLASACIITGAEDHVTPASELWRAYLVWCKRNAAAPISQTSFGRRLTERKGVRRETPHTVRYVGIHVVDRSLLEEPHDELAGEEPPPHDEAT